MFSSALKYIRVVLISLSVLSYLMVLLCLTEIPGFYYGDFIFIGSASIILFFLTEGLNYRLMRDKNKKRSPLKAYKN